MSFVRITSIEQGIDTFLSTPTNFAYKNISVNWAFDSTEGYLFQYGTMIAKRIGTIVWINKKFYSNTTSKLQNLIKMKAIEKGYRINEVEFMNDGGGISKDWSNPSYLSELDREDLKYVKFLYEQGEKELAYKTASDLDTIVRDEIPLSIWRDMGGKLTPVGEERLRKEQQDLSYASKTFSQTAEIKVKENLNGGMICINKLSRIIGKKPDYPTQIVGSIKLTKCFLKPYYRI